MRDVYTLEKEDMASLAQKVLDIVVPLAEKRAAVVHLEGELGAGKTTFVKALGRALRIEIDITSPTYVLRRDYQTGNRDIVKLIHIDAYRLVTKDEGRALALSYDREAKTVICIEWPGNMDSPEEDVRLFFEHIDDTTRRVTITAHDRVG